MCWARACPKPSPEAIARGHDEALPNTRFSFDMLGEGARTEADARRYFEAYASAIETIGKANPGDTPLNADGISVKLSALHPRYQFSQRDLVMSELLPRIRELAMTARRHHIGLSIDAEEAARLDLSLDIFEALARDPALADWNGLGFVLQAYQKRAPSVVPWLIKLAGETRRQFMVRLVKGAYWDTEIKLAQQQGLTDYPVFTRKVHTDLCYLHCAQQLLAAPEALYPQFATHNAQTITAIQQLAGDAPYEFQRLHGMGEVLYQTWQQQPQTSPLPPVRVYAPVGEHRELLPYLVRRLLENGANSSFVNHLLNDDIPVNSLVQPLLPQVLTVNPHRHRLIPLPANIYRVTGEERRNAPGMDLNNPLVTGPLIAALNEVTTPLHAGPIVGGELQQRDSQPIISPTDGTTVVGYCTMANDDDVAKALQQAAAAQWEWNQRGGAARAEILERMADLLTEQQVPLLKLIAQEAGRTIADALAEVREAIDFCHYYALQARYRFSRGIDLPGPTGESNQFSLEGRGVFLCISPWNFPLAIFTGQTAAALVAGNTVIAKPALQTPLVAAKVTELFHRAGVPAEVLHLLPGEGAKLGERLLPDPRIAGVAFTGSTATAKTIQRQLARRPGAIVPLIAETGGQNVMLVDSTALPEQVVDDVIYSAFLSAGQRCSALRVLFIQDDIADGLLTTLTGALQTLKIGNPAVLATDIGPVIDGRARDSLMRHIERISREGTLLGSLTAEQIPSRGYFVAPHLVEIDSLAQLPEEVFGPILHVIRYRAAEVDRVLAQINDSGFGLTLGIQSRLKQFADYVFSHTRVGNTYINRNMVGAVVGSNPFGGCGLSGTGPKAGGPHYLMAFATEKTRTENTTARGGNTALFSLPDD
ncbi:bifunctional proline dehydrogenase/L-glutamate gamma-semialdehyde dehydrogenase PutA [Porticoccus sp.]|uniref:bifunctional proline dehydrogenase/L-glutamate gamma-semialdehyde dehydrogenase PutA n=1 Tax=Porticoccus sp. TaxID=2024853 RepID=UPI0026012EDA|nr:bifunctional proline dehydrogenase/L-glutamate gamma-semialdehyde dehydrogenase PutA [Porticoccus sp.]